MKTLSILPLTLSCLLACSTSNNIIEPKLYQESFPGFDIKNSPSDLTGYVYQSADGSELAITHCKQADNIEISNIADFDYFRFKLLDLSCKAIDKYSTASASKSSNLPATLDAHFIQILPATITPLLSKNDFLIKKKQSIKSYYPNTKIVAEKENTFKISTEEDDIYITILARADFTNDGVEDLLIQTEWYARKAHGKHADLLIISQTIKDKPPVINWRLNGIDES